MPDSLRPEFFLLRENGSKVPLIAMDELPPTINIRDVPRALPHDEKPDMLCIGTYQARHRLYIVDLQAQSTLPVTDRTLTASIHAPSNNEPDCPNRSLITTLIPRRSYGIQEQPPISSATSSAISRVSSREEAIESSTDADIGSKTKPLPPWHNPSSLPVTRTTGTKEYCSYWLRHGECDYAQQGCIYKHEMPLDKVTLQRLGHLDIPKWYRERHGLGSFRSIYSNDGSPEPEVGRGKEKENDQEKKNFKKYRGRDKSKETSRRQAALSRKTRHTGSSHEDSKKNGVETKKLMGGALYRLPATRNLPPLATPVETNARQPAIVEKVAVLDRDTESDRENATLLKEKFEALIPDLLPLSPDDITRSAPANDKARTSTSTPRRPRRLSISLSSNAGSSSSGEDDEPTTATTPRPALTISHRSDKPDTSSTAPASSRSSSMTSSVCSPSPSRSPGSTILTLPLPPPSSPSPTVTTTTTISPPHRPISSNTEHIASPPREPAAMRRSKDKGRDKGKADNTKGGQHDVVTGAAATKPKDSGKTARDGGKAVAVNSSA